MTALSPLVAPNGKVFYSNTGLPPRPRQRGKILRKANSSNSTPLLVTYRGKQYIKCSSCRVVRSTDCYYSVSGDIVRYRGWVCCSCAFTGGRTADTVRAAINKFRARIRNKQPMTVVFPEIKEWMIELEARTGSRENAGTYLGSTPKWVWEVMNDRRARVYRDIVWELADAVGASRSLRERWLVDGTMGIEGWDAEGGALFCDNCGCYEIPCKGNSLCVVCYDTAESAYPQESPMLKCSAL